MTSALHETTYPDAEALAVALAVELGAACRNALDTREFAFLALAGGRTPLPAYRLLARAPLDWRRIRLVPTDERCVPHTHPASNVAELRAAFAAAEGVEIISLTTADGDPERSVVHAVEWLGQSPDPFDAVVLGMGLDAHTASLFPGAPQLMDALTTIDADACRVDPHPLPPEAPFPRITLTLHRLQRTRALHLAITGAAKRTVLQQALEQPNLATRPVSALWSAPTVPPRVHWSP